MDKEIMAESKHVIDLKKAELAEELKRKNPNKDKIKRLQDSIERHKVWEKDKRECQNRRRRDRLTAKG
jgi:hypothetical protein